MKNSLLVLGLFLMVSCSPKVVGIYNPGSLPGIPKSYYVYLPEDEDSFSPERQKLDKELVNILINGLENKGLKQSSLPDLYVSFIISVHATEEFDESIYNAYDPRWRWNRMGYYDPTLNNSQQFKEGVLIIDIRNVDNKLVWQGSKAFKLSARHSSTDEIIISCREIIAAFDPQQVN